MPMRRCFLTALPLLAGGAALAQAPATPPRMVRASGRAAQVHAGAGTEGGATTGTSGPQQDGGGEASSAGTLGATQPGGSGRKAGSTGSRR